MADSAPNTGDEPKLANFFSYLDPEHTPINIYESHHNFLCPDGATVIPTNSEGLPNSGASSSSNQTAASRAPSMFGPQSLWKQGAMSCVGSFWPPGNWGRVGQRICCSNDFEFTVERKRDRDTNVVHSLKDRKKQKILERKADLAVPRRGGVAQQKKYEAEAEVEARNWEKRNSDIAFREIHQEFGTQRFQLHQASRWADQAQRDKISLHGGIGIEK